MRLELKDIKGGVLEQEYSLTSTDFPELQVLAEDGAGHYLGPLNFSLRYQQSGRIVEVDGRLSSQVELRCGRCLSRYQLPVEEEFSFTFTPVIEQLEEGSEVELEAEELGLVLYRDDVLELLSTLQEYAVMSMPVAQLCRQDCQGLCPECGQDLNEKQCDCCPKPFNNKFGSLANLFDKNN